MLVVYSELVSHLSGLAPSTTYYFAVQAVDSSARTSPMSAMNVATTAAPPTAPSNVAAAQLSGTALQITWTPASGSGGIAVYNIFLGTSPTSLAKAGATVNTTFTARSLTAGATYYIAIQATDGAGEVSPMSVIAAGTTLI